MLKIFTHGTDHDLDHLAPNLPFLDVEQDLYSTDQTQETCAAIDHSNDACSIETARTRTTKAHCVI